MLLLKNLQLLKKVSKRVAFPSRLNDISISPGSVSKDMHSNRPENEEHINKLKEKIKCLQRDKKTFLQN